MFHERAEEIAQWEKKKKKKETIFCVSLLPEFDP